MTLAEMQFALDDVVFGAGTKTTLENVSGLGLGALRERRTPTPDSDGTSYQREYRDPAPIVFEGNIVEPGEPGAAWDSSNAMARAFDASAARRQVGGVVPLRMRRPGGDERLVFGRPDRYDPELSRQAIGLIPWQAQFSPADALYYGAEERQQTLLVGTAPSGAYIVTDTAGNLIGPISTIGTSAQAFAITNAGDADSWLTCTISGPISEPAFELLDENGQPAWTVRYLGTLAFDQTLVVDTSPWSRGLRVDGIGGPGAPTSPETWLGKSTLPPGTHQIRVSGTDPTGTATFAFQWRDAYLSY